MSALALVLVLVLELELELAPESEWGSEWEWEWVSALVSGQQPVSVSVWRARSPGELLSQLSRLLSPHGHLDCRFELGRFGRQLPLPPIP